MVCYTKYMAFNFLQSLNLRRTCKDEYGVTLWRCPSFLFIVFGFVVVLSIITAYIVGSRYSSEPELSALLALATAAVTFILGQFILHGITKVIQVSKMKSQFLNLISHQLLTPLTVVKWCVNALEDPSIFSSTQEREELLRNIKLNSNTLIQTVESLLDVSRLETGKLKLNFEKCNIAKIIEQNALSHREAAETKNIKIIYSGTDKEVFVYADSVRLKVVIQQLLDNAIKYSKPDTSISVVLHTEDSMAVLNVEDAGKGIPQEEHKNIFGKFFHGKTADDSEIKGLGVGLFIAKSIIEASRGKIDFKSQEGVGSTFWFSLPLYHN